MVEATLKEAFMILLFEMTYSATKSARDAEKAIEATLKDNTELYKLLERYDERLKAKSS
jgi:hypothetical protein